MKNKENHQSQPREEMKGTVPEPSSQATGETVQLSKQDYEALQNRLKELEGMKEQLLRSAADFDNAKKRLVREREEFLKFGQENLIRNLLPVLDNFDRALFHADDSANLAGIVKGIEMVLKQLQDALQGQGLKKLSAVGEKFDPHLHEAVGYVQGEGPEDVVVEELEAGYKLHDRLLRPAKVRVRMSSPSGAGGAARSADKDTQDEIT